ncbi:TPA: DUF6701 domain-containing protein [Aeromonas veronii]
MRNLFLIICLYIMVSPVWAAIDCNSIFPGPIQSHDADGTLYMQGGARVDNYNGFEVCFKKVRAYNEEMNSLACGTGKCEITGISSKKQVSLIMPGGTDNKTYSIPSWGNPSQVVLGQTSNYGKAVGSRWDAGQITVSGNIGGYDGRPGSLGFSDFYDTYVIKGLTIQNKGVVTLISGKTYVIDGDLKLSSGEIKLIGSAPTRLFVKGDFDAYSDTQLSANSDMEVYISGAVTLTGNNVLAGSYYVEGNATFENDVTLFGRVSAKNVNLKGNSKVIYDGGVPPFKCESSETFDSANSLAMWALSAAAQSTLPSVKNGRLQLTTNDNSQSTAATYKMLFPGADNQVVLEFDHFAYGGSGADGMAVVLSDGLVTAQPGAAGGPLGYGARSNVNGFAGGWLGIGLDEYGNFSTEGGPRGAGPGARRPQSVVIRGSGSGTSGYSYLAGACINGTQNTGSCLSPRVDGNGSANPVHRYRIEVDSRQSNKTFVEVSRRTSGNQFTILIPRFELKGQVTTPNDFQLSLTGSTGGLTNFHELDNFQVCALQSRPLNVQIDHFRFDYSRVPLTCNPQDVTLTACANSDCSVQYKGPVTAYLLPKKLAQGEWRDSQGNVLANDQVTFSGGKVDLRLRSPIKGKITLGVEGSTPATRPLSSTLCRMGSGAYSIGACTIDFADSGFIFDVLDTYSNQPQDVTISAVKKDDITKQCVPGFTGVRSVGFWGTYNNPNTNSFGSKISIDGNAIATYAGSVSSPTPTTLNLTFDNQGKATLKKVTYPDAGQMQLSASHNGSGETEGLVMTGADTFVARPVGLCITPPQGVCAVGDSSCPVFKKAGETFLVDIKAMAWESANDGDICAGNLTTPNFALPNIALGSTLVAPNPGTNATLGTTAYSHVAAANSLNSVSQTVSEVGVFRMTVTPPVNGYFNYTIPSAQSQPVGRFIPADFNLVSGDIVPACNAFSYMGQPFGVMLDVLARNTTGVQTRNYTGPFAKGEAYLSVANDKDGKSLSSRLRSLQPLPWLNGRAALTTGSSEFVRLSGTQPDGPYKSLLFGLYMRDNDGDRTLIASPNFNDAVVGNCSGSGCNARQIDSVPMKAYFGRLQAGTAAGLASAPLAIPLQMQYYEAGNWLQNKEDQCTQLSLANQGFTFLNSSHTFDAATRELNLGAGRKIKLGLGSSAPGGDAALAKEGEILFHFAKPDISVRIPYKVELAKQPSSPLWLSDPTSANDGNLQGEAIFGSSRGNDRIIYRREVLH